MKNIINRINFFQLKSYRIPFFLLLMVCFAGAILGDSTTEALLLSNFGAEVIPKMYIINAVFLFLFSAFSMTIIDRVDRGLFFILFVLGHSLLVLLVWVAVLFNATFLFVPLFSYSYITKILLFLLFWTLVNDLVDSRHAGKDFPFIAAGGTLGAIIISFSIPWMLKVISPTTLLLLWSGISILLVLGFIPLQKSFGKSFKTVSDKQKHSERNFRSFLNDLKLVKKEPLLWSMSILYFLLFFILLNQQYEFYTAIKQRFGNASELAGFLGFFNGISMGVTFFIQISFAGFVLKKIGSTRSMFLLPVALCFVFGSLTVISFINNISNTENSALLLFKGIILGVGIRIAFFDSFFSPNFQIFFSSLPQEIRGRGKLSIEGVVKPVAILFSSFWLLFIAKKVSTEFNMMVLFISSVFMIIQTFIIRKKYTESLTKYLAGFNKDGQIPEFLNSKELSGETNILSALEKILKTESEEIKEYIIDILTQINTKESIFILTDYLKIANANIRSVIVTYLAKLRRDDMKSLLFSLLDDEDNRVIANTILALDKFKDSSINDKLLLFLKSDDYRIRANTVIVLWQNAKSPLKEELLNTLKLMLRSGDDSMCASAIYALSKINEPNLLLEELEEFYKFNKDLLKMWGQTWRQYKKALAKTGSSDGIKLLLDIVPECIGKRRNELINTLYLFLQSGYSLKDFIAITKNSDSDIKNIFLTALQTYVSKMNINIKKYEENLIKIAEIEQKEIYTDYVDINLLNSKKDDNAIQLLSDAILEEYVEKHLDSMLQVSAILDKSGQIGAVKGRIKHKNRYIRARAIEVLDNVGNMRINKWIINFLDVDNIKKILTDAESLFSIKEPSSLYDVVKNRMNDTNLWIRQCAEFAHYNCGL